jgi:peptide/nickel transport system permease protein
VGRVTDVQQSIPFLVLALAVVAVLGASLANLILVLGLGSWIFYHRVVRAEVLRIREQPYIEAARALGGSSRGVLWRHVLPNVLPSVIVVATLFVPQVIVFTAGLSFLGLGVPPPTPEWGRQIADGIEYLRTAWWLTLVPSFFLVVTVIGVNLVGDWLRDVLDPTLR